MFTYNDNMDAIQSLLQQSLSYINNGNNEAAQKLLNKLLQVQPKNVDAIHLLAIIHKDEKKYDQSLTYFDRAIKLDPTFSQIWYNKALLLQDHDQFEKAISCYEKAISLDPMNHDAWVNRGNAFLKLSQHQEAINSYKKAIQLTPDDFDAWFQLGGLLYAVGSYNQALASFEKVIELSPGYADAWSYIGIICKELRRYNQALASFEKVIELSPGYADAWSNKGAVLKDMGCYEEAMAAFSNAINLRPDYPEAWINKGIAYEESARHAEALICFQRAQNLKPECNYLLGYIINSKMQDANWTGLHAEVIKLFKAIEIGQKASVPFALLPVFDSPELSLKASKIWAEDKYPFRRNYDLPCKKHYQKIRIGYFSADFKSHPVSFLLAELFENHDRLKFEIFAFSYGSASKDDAMRKRLEKSFDHFYNLENKSDQEVVDLSRQLEIDIAVDLGGYTRNARTGIFALRAAPVQVNYLGYPGTVGASFMDYLIADPILIPESFQQFYEEKIVYLPNTYMVDDSGRVSTKKTFRRCDFNLPETSIIFCCFNNNFKIIIFANCFTESRH